LSPSVSRSFAQHFPASGWVEHEPDDLSADDARGLPRGNEAKAGAAAKDIARSGSPTSARRRWSGTGAPASRSIARSSGRTGAPLRAAKQLKKEGHEKPSRSKTGLLLDPYFSATKLAWILDHVPGARARAERGELAFGTVDCFLLWHLTGGKVHATDATNASRTLLFDIHRGAWDDELLKLFNVPRSVLPDVRDCR
jgi:glycerol kinase